MKKTTIKTKVLSIVSAAVMTFSVAAVGMASVSASSPNDSKGVVDIQLEGKPAQYFADCNAKMMAYFWNDYSENGQWKNVENKGNNTFSVSVPAGSSNKVVFARVSSDFNGGSTWNQTYDLDIECGKTCKITDYAEDSYHYTSTWVGGESKKEDSPVGTKETVSFKPDTKEWRECNAAFSAYFWKAGTSDKKWVKMEHGSHGNYVAEVPQGYTHVIFVRHAQNVTPDWSVMNMWGKTPDIKISDLGSYVYIGTNAVKIDF